ncbi:hypothetical protein [Shewanella sp.]|uniref:hypothetical protein n=1 Tax=Shewanella sp. TaxID=50422 RepID=UPI003A9879E7
MADMRELLIETATTFRLGREAAASVLFAQCIDKLQIALQQPKLAQQLMVVIPQLLEAQESRNWLGLADTLEYEVLPLLTPTTCSSTNYQELR